MEPMCRLIASASRSWLGPVVFSALLIVALSSVGSRLQAPAYAGAGAPAAAMNPVASDSGAATAAMTESVAAALDAFRQARLTGEVAPRQRLALPETVVMLPLVLYAPGVAPAPEPTPTPAPAADIAVTLRPDPSIRVTRGTILEYELRVRNYGAGWADQVRVTLPYDNRQVNVIDSRFEGAGDFVSELTENRVVVTFGAFRPDERRNATLLMRVNADLPDDAVISIRASFAWDDARDDGQGRSNWAPVLVGGFNNSSPFVFLEIVPERGPAGIGFSVYTDRFIPGEQIAVWLSGPGGLTLLDIERNADSLGRVGFTLSSAGLAPATYELILFGARSRLSAVNEFSVDPAP